MKTIWTLFFIAIQCSVYSQIISSTVLEDQSNEPIQDAFVFIANTSIGAITNEHGEFILNIQNLENPEIVISHLNYALKSIRINKQGKLESQIHLTPKSVTVDEIIISGAQSGKRKEWEEKFNKAFLGNSKRTKTTINNPEVLLFSEDAKGFHAFSDKMISISNKLLGYDIRFFLDSFLIDQNNVVSISGKIFFEDKSTTLNRPDRIQRFREKVFLESRTSFFQMLASGIDPTTHFGLGVATFSNENRLKTYLPIEDYSTIIGYGRKYDTLYIEDYLMITKGHVSSGQSSDFDMKQFSVRKKPSGIKSKSNQIIFNQNGEIINQLDIIEIGEWGDTRISRLLPLNFNFIDTPKPSSQNTSIVNHLEEYLSNNPREKIYLQTNKPFYSIQEEVFYTVYYLNGQDHTLDSLSKIIHVELIDKNGIIRDSHALHLNMNTEGSFRMDTSFRSGTYQIRAYTQHMRNYDQSYFFSKYVDVVDYSAFSQPDKAHEHENLAMHVSESSPAKKQELIDLQFFPEGGSMIDGISTNIAFRATNSLGKSIEIQGQIIDEEGNQLTTFKSLHDGMGVIHFLPHRNMVYQAVGTYQSLPFSFPLPQGKSTGFVLKVNSAQKDKFFINVFSESKDQLANAFIVGHVRGEVVITIDELDKEEGFALYKEDLPLGLLHLTLFDQNGVPHAERLLFNDWNLDQENVAISAQSKYEPRKKVDLNLVLVNEHLDLSKIKVSASVVDASIIRYNENEENIKSYILLNSELNHPIPSANLLTQNINQEKRFLLDLYLMTFGWRKFNWDNILDGQTDTLTFKHQQEMIIRGHTTGLRKDHISVKTNVMLNSIDENFYLGTQETAQDGKFLFDKLPISDSIPFILQARRFQKPLKKDENGGITMEGRRDIRLHLEHQERPKTNFTFQKDGFWNKCINQPEIFEFEKNAEQAGLMFKEGWQIELEEVVVRAKGLDPRLFNIYSIDQIEHVSLNASGVQLIRSIWPSMVVVRNPYTGEPEWVTRNRRGDPIRVQLAFIVNGFLVPSGYAESITADRIDYIGRNDHIIFLTIRQSGPRSLHEKLGQGILHFIHPGYHRARTFYSPKYESNETLIHPDLRTAIHWEPNISFDENQSATISFYTADTPTKYQVRIEGIQSDGTPIFRTFHFDVEE